MFAGVTDHDWDMGEIVVFAKSRHSPPAMSVRSCRVTIRDSEGVEHSAEVCEAGPIRSEYNRDVQRIPRREKEKTMKLKMFTQINILAAVMALV